MISGRDIGLGQAAAASHFVYLLKRNSALVNQSVIMVQRMWRAVLARQYVNALRQEKRCRHERLRPRTHFETDCSCCTNNEADNVGQRIVSGESTKQHYKLQKAYRNSWLDTERLLFKGMPRVCMYDAGDNWNSLFQKTYSLAEDTEFKRSSKWLLLTMLYRDFTAAAIMYGRTIISEIFLHGYLRSIRPQEVGGFAGGKKYLFRGILFKLADGSVGPWAGSDESAAKGTGHELRGQSYYAYAGINSLKFPPTCLIDYKGFRMICVAQLPVGNHTLKSGSKDGGRTVIEAEDKEVIQALKEVSAKLGLKEHMSGGAKVYTAADVEIHKGTDGNIYMLDLARCMPPEDPTVIPHFNGVLRSGTSVVVKSENRRRQGMILKANPNLASYDVVFADDGSLQNEVPVSDLEDNHVGVFWRLMRPEFVADRGRLLLEDWEASHDIKFSLPQNLIEACCCNSYAKSPIQEPSALKKAPHMCFLTGISTVFVSQKHIQGRIHHRYVRNRHEPILFEKVASKKLSFLKHIRLGPDSDAYSEFSMKDFPDTTESTLYESLSPDMLTPIMSPQKGDFQDKRRSEVFNLPEIASNIANASIAFSKKFDLLPCITDVMEHVETKVSECIAFESTDKPVLVGHDSVPVMDEQSRLSAATDSNDHQVVMRSENSMEIFNNDADLVESSRIDLNQFNIDNSDTDTVQNISSDDIHHLAGQQFQVDNLVDGLRQQMDTSSAMSACSETDLTTSKPQKKEKISFFTIFKKKREEYKQRRNSLSILENKKGPLERPQNISSRELESLPEIAYNTEGKNQVKKDQSCAHSEISGGSSHPKESPLKSTYNTGVIEDLKVSTSTDTINLVAHEHVPSNVSGSENNGETMAVGDFMMAKNQNVDLREIEGSLTPQKQEMGTGYEALSPSSVEGSQTDKNIDYKVFLAVEHQNKVTWEMRGSLTPPKSQIGAGYEALSPGSAAGFKEGTSIGRRDSTGGGYTSENNYSSLSPSRENPEEGLGMGVEGFTRGDNCPEVEKYTSLSPDRSFTEILDGSKGPCLRPSIVRDNTFTDRSWEENEGDSLPNEPPPPLSADAFTNFADSDCFQAQHNVEVRTATILLMTKVVPALAWHLCRYLEENLGNLDISAEFHQYGVNVRHTGLVRSCIPATEELGANKQCFSVREKLLVEMVGRTLKNVLREFQRRWMRSEQTTSDGGMYMLVAQFLNLVTGQHVNSAIFWNGEITTGVMMRFGIIALTPNERTDLLKTCSAPQVLRPLIMRLLAMTGVNLTQVARKQLESDRDICKFEFLTDDIVSIDAVVKKMHIPLKIAAQMHMNLAQSKKMDEDFRVPERLLEMALEDLKKAHECTPSDQETLVLIHEVEVGLARIAGAAKSLSQYQLHLANESAPWPQTYELQRSLSVPDLY